MNGVAVVSINKFVKKKNRRTRQRCARQLSAIGVAVRKVIFNLATTDPGPETAA